MQNRIEKLCSRFQDLKIGSILISSPKNIFYLTGISGLSENEREFWLVVTKENTYIITDGRYADYVNEVCEVRKVRKVLKVDKVDKVDKVRKVYKVRLIQQDKNLNFHLNKIADEEKIKSLGFEKHDLKYSEFKLLSKMKLRLKGTENIVEINRALKQAEEIKYLRKACQLTDKCFSDITKTIKSGMTERKIADMIIQWANSHGADISFYPIVAIDKNSAIPHYNTRLYGERQVAKPCLIMIDFGIKYWGYCADMTRMVFFGKNPNSTINIYMKLLKVQQKTIAQISKSQKWSEIDRTSRAYMASAGLPQYPHSTGHGLGLDVHELPKISSKSKDKILPNQVVTIEPAVYFPGKFGIRVEDDVIVKNDTSEILTRSTKKTIMID